jgi:hypothetical protein
MTYSGKAGGNGQNIAAGTNATAPVMMPSSPLDGTLTGCARTYIIAGSYVGLALLIP